MTFRRAP